MNNSIAILYHISQDFYHTTFTTYATFGKKSVAFANSSGFAAHPNLKEAASRGFLELLERDAMMRSWFEKQSPRIVSKNLLSRHLRSRVDYWSRRGFEVFTLDLSHDGVAIVIVVIRSLHRYPHFVSGAGSSFINFDDAVLTAFNEAESRLIFNLNTSAIPKITPEGVRDVLDHEALYAQSLAYHSKIAYLFEGVVITKRPHIKYRPEVLIEKYRPVIVRVDTDDSPLYVVKVLSTECIPISFGYESGYFTHHTIDQEKLSDPLFPHFFA
jgi:hypothetical protein